MELLASKTAELLPEVAQIAFASALESINSKGHAAKIWLTHGYIPSAFAGSSLVTIPILGSKMSVAAVQMTMLAHISNLFELPLDLISVSKLFSVASGIALDVCIGDILQQDSVKEILQQALNNLTQLIHSLFQEIPSGVPIIGGVIAGSSAALSTLIIGLAYIDVLKIYKQALLKGNEISLSELSIMLKERIKYYTQSGWEILKPLLYSGDRNWVLQ